MPRRPTGYREHGTVREQFVERMIEEMERRGWSDAGLAKRVSAHWKMSAATVWKIRKANPPKRVDLDEAHAIAQAFGYSTVEAFLLGDQARLGVVLLEQFTDHTITLTNGAAAYQGMFRPETDVEAAARPPDPNTIYYANAVEYDQLEAAGLIPTSAAEVARLVDALAETTGMLRALATILDQLPLADYIERAEHTMRLLDQHQQSIARRAGDDQ